MRNELTIRLLEIDRDKYSAGIGILGIEIGLGRHWYEGHLFWLETGRGGTLIDVLYLRQAFRKWWPW